MKKFSKIEQENGMKYGQPVIDEKNHMKNILISVSGNDQRVLNDLVECLTLAQMKECFDKLSKVYGYTGNIGKIVKPSIQQK